MDGLVARVSYQFPRFSREQSVWFDTRYTGRLKPEENGRVLRLDLETWEKVDGKTQVVVSRHKFAKYTIRFMKVDP